MQQYFMDLHIHIGASSDKTPVKITASRNLTFENIVKEAYGRKGIDIIGIIDCASPPVIEDIKRMIEQGELILLPGGGYRYKDQVTVFLGSEVESKEAEGGRAHFLAFFPTLEQITEFSKILAQYVTNISLSSQMTYLSGKEILQIVDGLEGVLIPAHAFTPYKSIYGNCASSLKEIFPDDLDLKIKTIELGLSADTEMADHFSELSSRTFLSNSDAHSLSKIGREYNLIQVKKPDFEHIFAVLAGKEEIGQIVANYGMDPRLGKYHRSFCENCQSTLVGEPPQFECEYCGSERVVRGVWDRIVDICDREFSISPPHRPPYHYQIPLENIPGVGRKTVEKLIDAFKSEMNVLHRVGLEELKDVVPSRTAENIVLAREGKLTLLPGGGGNYGKAVRK
ncbi:hypothetical protein BBF96_08605 [Anoxybacter fermentans]|uniref:TIGR00375 family protein n=1 Tax=Anoxybacter fermentans TaxID=1323375 RepID=A0A3S9SYK8_9FIRM|nr:endonuclease Q family protein [Anoxybacter fermentans]AZR73436.1 hypothetical protein BBF96_08605 [Anoxybacter fermentans]